MTTKTIGKTRGSRLRLLAILFPVALLTASLACPAHAGTRIVGGGVAAIGDYPWTVAIVDAQGYQFCGGTLIGASTVVTAAHCVADRAADGVYVVGGRTDISQLTPGDAVSGVTEIDVRTGYTSALRGADAAILTLQTGFPYQTLPVATAADTALYQPGTTGTVLGWGRLARNGATTTVLRKATMPIVDHGTCQYMYNQVVSGSTYDPNAMFCAGYFSDGTGSDACQGDSGGPFVVNGKLIGIVSWGIGCGRYPGYYTRVATYFG
jgi:secreted trypsin-like serine protease